MSDVQESQLIEIRDSTRSLQKRTRKKYRDDRKSNKLIRISNGINILIIVLGLAILLKFVYKDYEGGGPVSLEEKPMEEQQGSNGLKQMALTELFAVPHDQQLRIKQKGTSNNSIMSGDKRYFAYRLFLEPDNALYHQLQHYYYQKQYPLTHPQNSFSHKLCLILTGDFLSIHSHNLKKLLFSIDRQSYQNYVLHLDYSQNNQQIVDQIYSQLKLKNLKKRTVLVKNNKKIEYLDSKRAAIMSCEGEIVVDVPLYGELIGRDALSLIDYAISQNDDFLLGSSKSIFRANGTKFIQQGFSLQINQHQEKDKVFQIQPLKFFKKTITLQILEIGLTVPKNSPSLTSYHTDLLFYASILQKVSSHNIILLNQFLFFQKHPTKTEFSEDFITYFTKVFMDEAKPDFIIFKNNIKNHFGKISSKFNNDRSVKYQTKEWEFFIGRLLSRFLMEKHPSVNNMQFVHKFPDDKFSSQRVNLAYHLWKYPENQIYMEAERFFHEQKYGKLTTRPEIPFCIVADGQIPPLSPRLSSSIYPQNDDITFLASVSRLEYQNFRLILGLTEPEEGFRKNQVKRFLSLNYPYLLEKTTIVYSNQSLPHGRVKYNLIKDYCRPNQFVIPIQIDCQFIGRQALKLLNLFLFKDNPKYSIKLFYTSHLSLKDNTVDFQIHDLEVGTTIKETKFEMKNHAKRINHKILFNSYYLYVFQRPLLDKISLDYLCPQEDKCVKQLTDGFLFKALLRLSDGYSDFRNEILMYVSQSNMVVREKTEASTLQTIDEIPYLKLQKKAIK